MGPATAAVHVRDNASISARLEKQLLVSIARRLPREITSDHLSMLSLLSMAAAGLAFAAFRFTAWAALGVAVALVANWFGDSMDGTVARVREQQRPRYGFYVDHIIDLAGTTMLVVGMGCSGLMHPLIAGAALAGYLLVSSETYLATHASGVFRMSFLGFGPTELRVVLIIGALRAVESAWVQPFGAGPVRLFDIGGIVAMCGLLTAFIVSSVRNTRALYLAEPIPVRRDEERA